MMVESMINHRILIKNFTDIMDYCLTAFLITTTIILTTKLWEWLL